MPCIKAARPEIQALDTTTGLLVRQRNILAVNLFHIAFDGGKHHPDTRAGRVQSRLCHGFAGSFNGNVLKER